MTVGTQRFPFVVRQPRSLQSPERQLTTNKLGT